MVENRTKAPTARTKLFWWRADERREGDGKGWDERGGKGKEGMGRGLDKWGAVRGLRKEEREGERGEWTARGGWKGGWKEEWREEWRGELREPVFGYWDFQFSATAYRNFTIHSRLKVFSS